MNGAQCTTKISKLLSRGVSKENKRDIKWTHRDPYFCADFVLLVKCILIIKFIINKAIITVTIRIIIRTNNNNN